ncbi:MAG TPA: DUF418 domain-containing protein [Terricaulis sp.]|nr:DUF418 domain-containing protein [Terricaulis sp.]HRP09616.1 DUF418 domain-containing protein [Terricaulis sp.]
MGDAAQVAPVAEPRRIKSLDVMRGFAVLGILAVNAAYFAAPWQTGFNPTLAPLAVTPDTLWAWLVMHVFFEFKCITLFSILFGASLYMVGGERADKERGAVLRRRLLWLLIFGLIHALLIWYGDILVTYALTGFLVLFARSWRPATLISVGVILIIVATTLSAMLGIFFDYIPPAQLDEIRGEYWSPSPEALGETIAQFQASGLGATLANMNLWFEFIGNAVFFMVIRTAGVMMIGMALFKLGFLSGNASGWVYGAALALGAAALALIAWQAQINIAAGFSFEHMQRSGLFANGALAIFVSIGYAALFVLLVKLGVRLLTEPLAAVGRMAFSNYIMQSLIMTAIFYGGRGLGYFGEVDRVGLWGIVVAIWALQLVISPLWLARYQMGPLEWLWRRLSYGRPVAIARA